MQGTTLGPYRIDRELGSGGMGKVYSATVTGRCPGLADGTVVALKVVHPHLLETPGFFKRFLREAEIGKSVVHENVVRTFDCDQLVIGGTNYSFISMEYVEGQTLRELLKELDRVPEELCRHIGREVAKGLAAIHATGVVHRDLKPENVLITRDHAVKVMDLGVARLSDEALRLSHTGAFVGSIHYAAPECFTDGGTRADGRADLHALGLVLYELATGVNPYFAHEVPQILRKVLHEEPRRLGDLNQQLSPFFEEAVHCLLAKNPSGRFADAATLLAVLEEGEASAWWRSRAKAIHRETKRPLRRIRIPRETAVYGRDAELAKMRALYERARSGEGQALLIEGEAGIGKSRLVDEFVGQLQREGEDLNYLFGSYPPGGAATAASAVATAYREQLGAENLTQVLGAYLPQTPLLVPAFAALLRGDGAPRDAEQLTKDSLQNCFAELTRSIATERPTVILVDDLHFAPDDGRSLFAALATAIAGLRVLLVGTTRPGADEKWIAQTSRMPHVAHFSLARLGPKDLSRLLVDAFRSERLAEELAFKVGAKSDGNPFFVFEILRGLREGQFITKRDDGTWVNTRVVADIEIPSSIVQLVHARVADLDDAERNFLDVASCCGFEFDARVVAAALGLPRVPALQMLGRIEKRHRLVRSAGSRFVFDHHQVQEALFEGISEPLREEYHAAIGAALEEQSGLASADPKTASGAVCVQLAQHFLAGCQGARALRYMEPALDHLVAGYQFDEMRRLASRALAQPGLLAGTARVAMLLRKMGPADLVGSHADDEATLREALELARAAGDDRLAGESGSRLGLLLVRRHRPGEAREVLLRAIEAARSCGDFATEAPASGNLGHVVRDLEGPEQALPYHQRQLDLSREHGYSHYEGNALGNLGQIRHQMGQRDAALELAQQALAVHERGGHRLGIAFDLGQIAGLRETSCRYEDALTAAKGSAEIDRSIGCPERSQWAFSLLVRCCLAAGRIGEAESWLEGMPRGESGEDGGFDQLHFLTHRLEWCRVAGELDEARRVAGVALPLAIKLNSNYHMTTVRRLLAGIEQARGAMGEAETLLVAALEDARRHKWDDDIGLAALALGRFLVDAGRRDAAEPHLVLAAESGARYGWPWLELLARTCRLRADGGDAAPALALLPVVADRAPIVARIQTHFDLWKATKADVHLREAAGLLAVLRDGAPERLRESMLTADPLYAAVSSAAKHAGL